MNKARRERIKNIAEKLQEVLCDIEDVQNEEQEYLDSLPDNLQNSQRAEAATSIISTLEDIFVNLEAAITDLEEMV